MRRRRQIPWLLLSLLLPALAAGQGLEAKPALRVTYAGQAAGRTVAHAVLSLPAVDVGEGALSPRRFVLTGEVRMAAGTGGIAGTGSTESFRYPLRAALSPSGETLLLEFERSLPPGDCILLIQVEDLASHRSFFLTRTLSVPRLALA
jgi:hypothetical protein